MSKYLISKFLILTFFSSFAFADTEAKNKSAEFENEIDSSICTEYVLLNGTRKWAELHHSWNKLDYLLPCIKTKSEPLKRTSLTYVGYVSDKMVSYSDNSDEKIELKLPHFFFASRPLFHNKYLFYVGFKTPNYFAIKYDLETSRVINKKKLGDRRMETDNWNAFPYPKKNGEKVTFQGEGFSKVDMSLR